jgi:type II secretory pathway pseudopilin PulG
MQLSKKQGLGYTILELVITMTIAIIIASSITFSMRNFMIERSLEKEAVNFWKTLCSLRARAMKHDMYHFVDFEEGFNSYTIWKNDAETLDGNEEPVPNPFLAEIEYGIPIPAPTSGPDVTATPASAIEWDWAANDMIIKNDDLGTINYGRICLSWARMPKIVYCIQLKTGTQNIKLFKWNGSSWIEM